MMTTRQSALYALLLGGLIIGTLGGCSAGNPNMSEAQSAMEQQNYERALANVDTAIVNDSANVDAYMLKARILRSMADSTTPPERYKELHQRAREAEDEAIKFAPGRRSEVETQRRLAYIQEFQRGAQAFNQAQQSGQKEAFLQAAAYFGAAGAIRPDSTGPILNEAYARLNAAQRGENTSEEMSSVIPILERYLEKEDEPSQRVYSILTRLYIQGDQPGKAIEVTERAIDDLSSRSPHFRLSGTQGVSYTGTIESGGTSRQVKGTVPGRVALRSTDGTVTGRFQKGKQKGRVRVGLYVQGKQIASKVVTAPAGTLSISQDLSSLSPLAELQNLRLNAYNQAGRTSEAMGLYREQIERNPNNATYRYNYGSLLLNQDRFDEAITHLGRAAELDPDDPKKQFNLGAAYLNKGVTLQDSLLALRDSVLEQNREPTEEERKRLAQLDEQRRKLFKSAIPALERARRLSGPSGEYRQQACSALFRAYVQLERQDKAEEVQKCAGAVGGNGGGSQGGGSSGGGGLFR